MRITSRTVVGFVMGAAIAAVSGCGTVFHGPKQGVVVNSEPGGARVFVDGNEVGQTPTVVFLRRKTDHRVDLKRAGYRDHAFYFKSAPTTWVLVTDWIFFATILPTVLDGITGNWNSFDENAVKATLTPIGKP